jgi:TPR repeat protein
MQRKRASVQQRSTQVGQRISSFARASLLAAAARCAMSATAARADVAECERSYQLGRKDEAIRLCRRTAWQENDFFAQVKLGDIYSAKREDDKGYYDPVEAFVWYFLAGRNSAIFDHVHVDAAADAVVTRLVGADDDARAIYRNLLQDERIDVRNRVTYIESCRGGEGFILLGQLHDPSIAERHQGQTGPVTLAPQGRWRRPIGPGGPARFTPGQSYPGGTGYPGGPTPGYPGSGGSAAYGYDLWSNKLCNKSDWLGWLTQGSSCSRYNMGESATGVFPSSVMEAMVFYQLADRAGHPIAKVYIDALKGRQGDTTTEPKSASQDVLAKAKAQRWLAPFEFYAAETRYRGETPSGLVHSDECSVNAKRAQALALGERLIPHPIRRDLLQFLGFFRGDGGREMARAISKYQDFLGDPQTGQFTPVQLTRLIQIGAVRGYARAQRFLGIMYVKGVGVVTDFVRAEKWLLAAAEQGDGEAMYALSELYTQGADGVEKSEDRANRFRQGAAQAGFQPVRAEFLRILESAPVQRDECKTKRCRRERERAAEQPGPDEPEETN